MKKLIPLLCLFCFFIPIHAGLYDDFLGVLFFIKDRVEAADNMLVEIKMYGKVLSKVEKINEEICDMKYSYNMFDVEFLKNILDGLLPEDQEKLLNLRGSLRVCDCGGKNNGFHSTYCYYRTWRAKNNLLEYFCQEGKLEHVKLLLSKKKNLERLYPVNVNSLNRGGDHPLVLALDNSDLIKYYNISESLGRIKIAILLLEQSNISLHNVKPEALDRLKINYPSDEYPFLSRLELLCNNAQNSQRVNTVFLCIKNKPESNDEINKIKQIIFQYLKVAK